MRGYDICLPHIQGHPTLLYKSPVKAITVLALNEKKLRKKVQGENLICIHRDLPYLFNIQLSKQSTPLKVESLNLVCEHYHSHAY